jgi:hypothetical protein
MAQVSKRKRKQYRMFRAFNLTTICQYKNCKNKIKPGLFHHKYCQSCWNKIRKQRELNALGGTTSQDDGKSNMSATKQCQQLKSNTSTDNTQNDVKET